MNYVRGTFEISEFNYNDGLTYLRRSLKDPKSKDMASLELAKLDVKMGEMERAKKWLTILSQSKDRYIRQDAIFSDINATMLLQDYEEALKMFEQVDQHYLNGKYKEYYRNLYARILWRLGKLKKSSIDSPYLYEVLVKKSDKALLEHIEKHVGLPKDLMYCYFIQNLNLKKLLNDVRESIQDMNGNYYSNSEKYIVHTEDPIGRLGLVPIHDICVVTVLGTKEIITMYPTVISDQYDKEGLAYSKALKDQRQKGK